MPEAFGALLYPSRRQVLCVSQFGAAPLRLLRFGVALPPLHPVPSGSPTQSPDDHHLLPPSSRAGCTVRFLADSPSSRISCTCGSRVPAQSPTATCTLTFRGTSWSARRAPLTPPTTTKFPFRTLPPFYLRIGQIIMMPSMLMTSVNASRQKVVTTGQTRIQILTILFWLSGFSVILAKVL